MEAAQNPYRMLQRVVRHGSSGVKALTALLLACGLGAALALALWWLLPLALLVAGLTYVVGQSFVELVRIIVDMMVPK